MSEITGLGGIFYKVQDQEATSAWYLRVLKIDMQDWGGTIFMPSTKGYSVLSTFKPDSTHFEPSTKEFMINFMVDDLDDFLSHVEQEGVAILKKEDSEYGKFAWIMDPNGVKIELWQPSEAQ